MDQLVRNIRTRDSLSNFTRYVLNNVMIVSTCIFNLKDPRLIAETFIRINDTGLTLREKDKSKAFLLISCYHHDLHEHATSAVSDLRIEYLADVWEHVHAECQKAENKYGPRKLAHLIRTDLRPRCAESAFSHAWRA